MNSKTICQLGLAAAALLACQGTHAIGDDALEVRAGYDLRYDDNLFRLPKSASPGLLAAAGRQDEKIGIASVGLHLNKPYSLQRIEANVSLLDYRYQNHNNLSFTATNYDAAWNWSLTPAFRGVLSTARSEILNSYGDIQNANVANQRTNVQTRLDGTYDLEGGAWSLLGGVNRGSQTSTQQTIGEDDSRTTALNAGVRRTFTSGSTLSATLKNTQGKYLNRTLSQASLLDDQFNQWDYGVRLGWNFTAQSTADLQASYISRKHANFGQRDFDGLTVAAGMRWSLSPKTTLQLGLGRELNTYQTANSNYTRTQRLSITPTWQVTEKTALQFRHELAQVTFSGSPSSASASGRQDTNNNSSLTFQWQPTKNLTASAALQTSRRTSNTAGVDFNSTQASLGAQLRF